MNHIIPTIQPTNEELALDDNEWIKRANIAHTKKLEFERKRLILTVAGVSITCFSLIVAVLALAFQKREASATKQDDIFEETLYGCYTFVDDRCVPRASRNRRQTKVREFIQSKV